MRFIRPFLVFLVFALIAAVILSWLLPTKQKLEKTVTINAHISTVYPHLAKLENFNKWSVWGKEDSSNKYVLSGKDGTVGASSSWEGDPRLSGKGRIEIIALDPGKKVEQNIHFIKPDNRSARSVFTLSSSGNTTVVTWNFEMSTPRPWNIFNLFYSMDKEMGKDFEKGLADLKVMLEKQAGTTPLVKYEVKQMDFPATRYAVIRQKIKFSDIASFLSQHFTVLKDEESKKGTNSGSLCGLFYEWNEKDQMTDVAAAILVPTGTKLENPIISTVNIPASKAVFIDYTDDNEKVTVAYDALRTYLRENNLKQKFPIIEFYNAGNTIEKDYTKWITTIVFLVE